MAFVHMCAERNWHLHTNSSWSENAAVFSLFDLHYMIWNVHRGNHFTRERRRVVLKWNKALLCPDTPDATILYRKQDPKTLRSSECLIPI